MPRQARFKGKFITYHIVSRGNERKNVFNSDDDKLRFLDTLTRMKTKYNFLVYAYCLMDNHIHLVINDNGNDISKLIKSINISYVLYFNRIYERCGHLFQDRFWSELIENDPYLLQVSKYIHNNPVRAGLVSTAEDYQWSSYNIYTGKCKDIRKLIDADKIWGIISSSRLKAMKAYEEYIKEEECIQVIDIEEDRIPISRTNHYFISNPKQAWDKINIMAEEKRISLHEFFQDRVLRNELMAEIRKNSSLSLKQIGQIFGGLSESRVSRILKKVRN